MENSWDDTLHSKKGPYKLSAHSFKKLIRFKEDEAQEAFNTLISTILPDVEGYIARRLSASVKNGHIPPDKYRVEEFVNELYVLAFEHISQIEDEKELPFWLFQKADELLQKTVVEEEYNTTFMDNLERYTKAEWIQMREDYSIDGEGEPTLLEEFDDPSYPQYEYKTSDLLFGESPEEKWLEEVDAKLSIAEKHRHIDMVLHRLPAPIKSIYDLAVNQRFEPYEIAKIKHISVFQVEQYLAQARKSIRNSFEGGYPQMSGQS